MGGGGGLDWSDHLDLKKERQQDLCMYICRSQDGAP